MKSIGLTLILDDSEVDGTIFAISNGIGGSVEASLSISIIPVDVEIPTLALAEMPFYLNSGEVLGTVISLLLLLLLL